jgi:hypothetical protein
MKKKSAGARREDEDPLEPEIQHLGRQISGIVARSGSSEEDFKAGVSIAIDRLAGIKPEDAVERMLSLQMVAAHEAAMGCLRRANLPDQPFAGRDLNLKHGVRLMSLYERQLAALDKHRGRGQQNVTVKYVHVSEGGQAIVGNVTRNGAATVPKPKAPPALEAAVETPFEIRPERRKLRAR